MKRCMALISAAFLATCSLFSLATAEEYFVSSSKRGFNLSTVNFELSFLSQVIAANPDWQLKFYTVRDPMEYINTPDRQSAAMVQTGNDEIFKLHQYTATVKDDAIYIDMTGELVRDQPVGIEYTMMMTPVQILAGANYSATLKDGSVITGTIPKKFTESKVYYYFKEAIKAEFTSEFGTLSVDVLEGSPFSLGDRRYTAFEGRNGFWFGSEQFAIEYNKPVTSKLRISFSQLQDLVIAPVRDTTGAETKLEAAKNLVVADKLEKRRMLPALKESAFDGGSYKLNASSNVQINIPAELGAVESDRLLRAAKRILVEQNKIPLAFDSSIKADIIVNVNENTPGIDNAEGYILSVDKDGVKIDAKTPRGAFYAMQTLRNLYNPEENSFDNAIIVDWPDMPYRGAMFLIDADSPVFHKNLIENILSPLKMNEIIMECEYAAWDTTKDLHFPEAITKEQIKELIAVANDNYMDASPLFQTLGHCEWLFGMDKNQNLDWAEDPDYPYAYNVSAPGLYEYMESILAEIKETFNNPKYLHIGHDEVFFFEEAKFPNRPENIAKGGKQIIFDDIMHYYNYAKKNDMRLMIWHDMFVTKEECPENGFGGAPHFTAELRKDLPKDIIIQDWRYYGGYTEYLDVETFRNEGFDVIGATWHDKGNHENLTPAVKKAGGLGMLQTIWNGYFGNGEVLFDGFYQVAPYTRTATWSWDARKEANQYDSHEVAATMLEPLKALPKAEGFTVNLDNIANLTISPENNPFLFFDTYEMDKMLPPGKIRIGQVEFNIPEIDGKTGAIALKSRLNPTAPTSITVPMNNVEAEKLFFLQTTLAEQLDRGTAIAKVTAVYADGSRKNIPVNYYSQIATPTDEDNYLLSPGNGVRLNGRRIWFSTWENPTPKIPISELIFEALPTQHSYYLFGISAQK